MNKMKKIEFVRTSTPGPYGIPLDVVDQNDREILFEIEIDGVTHTFSIDTKDVAYTMFSPEDSDLWFVEIGPDAMARLYGKIAAVMKSEKNVFIL